MTTKQTGYCIFIDTLCEGTVPAVRADGDRPYVFATRVEAERDLADDMITRLEEFLKGERDFEDAAAPDGWIDEVIILEDGSVADLNGGLIWNPHGATR